MADTMTSQNIDLSFWDTLYRKLQERKRLDSLHVLHL